MFRHRSFWIILVATTIVWLLFTMSDTDEYPMQMRVTWSGFDTSRYVVVSADTVLPITVTSNCFEAIRVYHAFQQHPFVFYTKGDTSIKVGGALFAQVAKQYALPNEKIFSSTVENIKLHLVGRQGKAFVPVLRDVDFEFADQRGLSGEPFISPDTVWIYGDPISLAKIDELTTAPAVVHHISDSGYVTLALSPVWKQYNDLHASADSIKVFLPVGRYVEETVAVPVQFQADADYHVQLYPPSVKVTLWVPPTESSQIDASSISAKVNYDPQAHELPVHITRFPANTRIKQITPTHLQYVIIK